MSTALLRLSKEKSKKLKSTAQDTFWVILTKLYCAHQSTYPIPEFDEILRTRDFDRALGLADYLSSQQYKTAHEHYVYNQFAFLIKKQVLPSSFNKEEISRKKFRATEEVMTLVNRRFNSWCIDTDWDASPTRRKYNLYLRKMRAFIAYTIGHEPPISSMLNKVGFGPGASLGVSGTATNAMRKLIAENGITVTPRAFTYLAAAVSQNLWLRRKFTTDPDGFTPHSNEYWVKALYSNCDFVRYNKIHFVPKTAKVLRTIAVEPLGNSLLQKGACEILDMCLKRVGIDLSQQTVNQEFARRGSLEHCHQIATIDLSSASDSVSTNVVKCLLPEPWFAFLNAIRSEFYELDGEIHKYQKFSSMGNGATFPIETLIFTAACVAVGCGVPGRDFTVYGDDIAVPKDSVPELLKLLRVMGFRTNNDKTFVEGPFRESCGEDWFGGVSVRPFVFDYLLDSVQNVFKFLNQSRGRPLWGDFFQPVRDYVLRLLPHKLHFVRPFDGPPDTAITAVADEHLISDYVGHKLGNWTWTELVSDPKLDSYYLCKDGLLQEPPDAVKWYAVHSLRSGSHTSDNRFDKPCHDEFPDRKSVV